MWRQPTPLQQRRQHVHGTLDHHSFRGYQPCESARSQQSGAEAWVALGIQQQYRLPWRLQQCRRTAGDEQWWTRRHPNETTQPNDGRRQQTQWGEGGGGGTRDQRYTHDHYKTSRATQNPQQPTTPLARRCSLQPTTHCAVETKSTPNSVSHACACTVLRMMVGSTHPTRASQSGRGRLGSPGQLVHSFLNVQLPG
jgi:hypothetical protein